MHNLLSHRKTWKSPVTPFKRFSMTGRDEEEYYDDYYYDDEIDRDDKDGSADFQNVSLERPLQSEQAILAQLPSIVKKTSQRGNTCDILLLRVGADTPQSFVSVCADYWSKDTLSYH